MAFAAETYRIAPDDIVFEAGEVRMHEHTLAFAALVHTGLHGAGSLSSTGYYRTPKIHYDRKTFSGRPFFYFSWGAAVTEVGHRHA